MSSAGADNLTAVLYAKDDLRLEQRPIPNPKDGQVLLRMGSVGICGSDVHYWTHGSIGRYVLNEPMVIGHEGAGTVLECGKNVTNLKPGDRVAIEPGVPCRRCDQCKRDTYNLCKDIFFCATPPDNRNLTRHYCHAADFCHKLPDNVTLEEGALLEPISVGVHACRKAGVTLGSKLLITGAGPIGLVTMMVAKTMGASQVIMTDISEHRLNVAEQMEADFILKVGNQDTPEFLAAEVEKILGAQPDVSVDACGMVSTVSLALLATRSGGCVVLVGMGSDNVNVPVVKALTREVDIKGVFRYANCYPMALSMVASGNVNVKQLITHKFTLEKTLAAFERAKSPAGGAIKVMINC